MTLASRAVAASICLMAPLLMAATYVACSGAEADLPYSSLESKIAETRRGQRGTFTNRLLLTGELEATRAVHITAPRVHGQLQIRWIEEDGSTVRAGQKVLEFDNAAFASDLEEKKLSALKAAKEIQQFEAQILAEAAEKAFAVEQRRIELEKAELEADVPKELLPLREYQEKQLARERARAALDKAVADHETQVRTKREELAIKKLALEKTQHEIRLAEHAIESLTLRAPRDGVLLVEEIPWEGRPVQEGDTVWPGFRLLRIPDLSEMRVIASLSDVDDGRIRPGMTATITLDAYPERRFAAEVLDITPVARETSPRGLRRAFRVRLELAETDPETMRPGMAARVEVETEE